MNKLIYAFALSLLLSSCTYSITMAHTNGTATDLVDEVATNTPTVSPTVTVPMTPGSSVGITK